jgi:hypothetical protein
MAKSIVEFAVLKETAVLLLSFMGKPPFLRLCLSRPFGVWPESELYGLING